MTPILPMRTLSSHVGGTSHQVTRVASNSHADGLQPPHWAPALQAQGIKSPFKRKEREEMEGLLASSPQEKWARWPFCWTEGLPSVWVPFLCP